MPDRRKPADHRLTVLEAFLLDTILHGLDSLYGIGKETTISRGALTPALRRLEQMRLLERGPASSRRRQAWRLTDAGKSAIKKFRSSSSAQTHSLEELLRAVALKCSWGREDEMIMLLRDARRARLEALKTLKAEKPPASDSDAVEVYAWAQAVCQRVKLAWEAAALRKLLRALSK